MVNVEGEETKKKISDIFTKIKRAFGFGFPSLVVVLHQGDDEKYVEDPEIKSEKEIKIKGKTYRNTIIRDKETNEIYYVRGELKKMLKPSRIVDYYPEAAMALLLPGFIIYTFILLWMFGVVEMSTFTIMLITFLLAMMFFQGRYVYTEGNIYGVDIAYKGDISGFKLYVPMVVEYLNLDPSENKHLENEVVERLNAYVAPILAENQLLMAETRKMADGYSKAFLLGMRMRKGYMAITEKYPAWMWAIVGVVIGIILGIIISGGVAPAPGGMP